MNETEQAELFNRELDALLRDWKEPVFAADPGAMSLAAELARADFSGESLIKESLRDRLAGGEAGGLIKTLRELFANNYARAAMAAALLLVALLPLARRPATLPENAAPARPVILASLPPVPPAVPEAAPA
ncbi:MAG: hypothetical protein Q8O90_13075, partial [Elusimicrobiota bacterium]|nr:hypothetical protein [Elusimicrobiota bacterium]